MNEVSTQMYVFDCPAEGFGGLAYGVDPCTAMASYVEGASEDFVVELKRSWTVAMIEVPDDDGDDIRNRLEEFGSEDYNQEIEEILNVQPFSDVYEVVVSPQTDGSFRYLET